MCEKSLECWGSCLMGVTSYLIGKGWVYDETDHFGWVGPSWYICSSSWRWCFTHHFMTWSMKKYTWMTDLWPISKIPQKCPIPPLSLINYCLVVTKVSSENAFIVLYNLSKFHHVTFIVRWNPQYLYMSAWLAAILFTPCRLWQRF